MKLHKILAITFTLLISSHSALLAASLKITSPKNGAIISKNVRVCFKIEGLKVEPAKNGINNGKGHHHILVDTEIPSNLKQPIGKSKNLIHMGDGSTCKDITLAKGTHTVRGLFANGGHIPYNPPVTDMVKITVK